MTVMWQTALLALIAMLSLVPLCWLRIKGRSASAAPSRDNVAIYREREHELNEAVAQGSLPATSLPPLMRELQAELLTVTVGQEAPLRMGPRWPVVAWFVVMVLMSFAGYHWLGQSSALRYWQQAEQHEAAYAGRFFNEGPNALSVDERQQLALALRSRLASQPSAPAGWLLLGRVQLSLNNVQQALDAYNKGLTLAPTDQGLLASRAEAWLYSGRDADYHRVIAWANKQANDDIMALFMKMQAYGLLAELDKAQAVAQQLLTKLATDDPRRQQVEQAMQHWQQVLKTPAQ